MDLGSKTKEELIREIASLRERLAVLSGKSVSGLDQESLKKFEKIVAATNDHISVIDSNYIYRIINNAYLKAHGKTREEIVGKPVAELLGPDVFKSIVKENFDRALSGTVVNYQQWFEFSTSGKRYMNVTYYPLYDDGGAVAGIVVNSRDITDYKIADEMVKQSEAKYRHLFENLKDAALLADASTGRIIETNAQGETLLGRTRDEIIGLHQSEIHPKNKDAEYRQKFARHIDEGRAADYDGEVIKKDGTVVQVHISASPVTLGANRLILGLFSDITERKTVEKNLLKEKDFSEELINGLPGIFYLFGEDLLMQRWNRNLEKATGYSGNEIKRLSLMEFIGHWDREAVAEKIKEVFEKGYVESEALLLKKDGTTVPYYFSGSKIVIDGVSYLLGMGLDITEHKNMEQELLKAQKLESLGVLAGGIAHDFNNVLTAISSNISLARLYAEGNEKAVKKLEEAEKGALRAGELTQQLLTFAKGGAPVKKKADMEALIRSAVDSAHLGSRVKCSLSIVDALPMVRADEVQLKQALQNIIANANDAMSKGGTLKITAENAAIAEDGQRIAKGHYVRVLIEDTGKGMDEEVLQKAFDPYFTTKKDGSGLGLTTAYAIIKRHGGYLSARSVPAQGTVMEIFIPAADAPEPVEKKPARAASKKGARGRILVMDDEEIIRDVAGEYLTHLGYEVELACDGAEAVELFRKAHLAKTLFSAVIMDLTVPGRMGGREALEKILEIDPQVRAIVSSGYCDDPVMADYRKYGFRGLITKPYKISDLGAAVSEVVSEKI